MSRVYEPSLRAVIDFCEMAPVERVFLEDVARRGGGRFAAVAESGRMVGLCHLGANLVPAGRGCAAFAAAAARCGARMIIGEQQAVDDLWAASAQALPPPREDRPGQPVYATTVAPPPGETGLRLAGSSDLELLLPACAAAHREELGVDPLSRDAAGFRWRTKMQIDEGRSWLWEDDGVIRFKAEASAWTPSTIQLQQVWTDPVARGHGYARRALGDLIRLLLPDAPTVSLFVRTDNQRAMRLYEAVGMRVALRFRSLLLP